MRPLFMLDTDTCIFLMRRDSQKLETKVQSVPLQQQVMSAVTLAELSYGVQASGAAKRKQNQATLDSLALHLAVLDWPLDAAKYYAEIRFAIVVTNNVKDFGRVKGLKVENWTQ
jgi:tRNA(fMet)-specific endonuclease VapC